MQRAVEFGRIISAERKRKVERGECEMATDPSKISLNFFKFIIMVDVSKFFQVHSIPMPLDYVLWGPDDCPRFFAAFEKYQRESPEVRRIYTDYADKFIYWSKMCGKNLMTINDVTQLYNTLRKENLLNKT